MDNFINTLKSYSDFASRTGRNDYWMFMLFYVVLSVATGIVDSILGILLVNSIYSYVGCFEFLRRTYEFLRPKKTRNKKTQMRNNPIYVVFF